MTRMVFVTNTTSLVSEVTHNGKAYLVSPVVAIAEGILNGLLYKASEFGKYLPTWELRPVPIGHPQRNGEYVSVNSVDVMETEVIGDFRNISVDNNRLKGEIWIDLEKVAKIGEAALAIAERLRAGNPVEVSTGLFADVEETTGVWDGKPFDGIARNIRPDHLALLPHEIGACSWEDGCGVPRVNKGEPAYRAGGHEKGEHTKGGSMNVNELDLSDRMALVRRALWERNDIAADGTMRDLDIVAMFDATVIAKDWDRKVHMAYPYSIADDGTVTFGEATPVEVVYRTKDGGAEVVVTNVEAPAVNADAIEQSVFGRVKSWLRDQAHFGISIQEQESMKKCDLVKALTTNSACKFSKEKLDTWNVEDLQALHDSLQVNAEVEQAGAVDGELEQEINMTVELPAELTEFAAMIQSLGGAKVIGEALGSLTANAQQEHAALVQGILANERNTFEEAELQAMSRATLQKLANSLQPVSYLGAGGFVPNSGRGSDEEVLAMPKAWERNGAQAQ